jgi:hypothetical protein
MLEVFLPSLPGVVCVIGVPVLLYFYPPETVGPGWIAWPFVLGLISPPFTCLACFSLVRTAKRMSRAGVVLGTVACLAAVAGSMLVWGRWLYSSM